MTVLTKPLEHDCSHPVAEHYINAADDRWHCHDCPCSRPRLLAEHPRSDVDLVTEIRFFGVDAKLTRDGMVVRRL